MPRRSAPRNDLFAFTLAEILITLGIIGVVAALTIPNIVSNYREKQTIIRLKKTLSVLQNASNFSKAENNEGLIGALSVYEGGAYDKNLHIDFANYFSKSLISNKACDNNCYARQVKDIKSNLYITYPYQPSSYRQVQLNDGTALLFRAVNPRCSEVYEGYWQMCGMIYIDVDGKGNGSTMGRDTFLFYARKDGKLLPAGIAEDESAMSDCYSSGKTCANWVLQNENLDYLHCSGLSWNGKKSCK